MYVVLEVSGGRMETKHPKDSWHQGFGTYTFAPLDKKYEIASFAVSFKPRARFRFLPPKMPSKYDST